jgi:hypothetical protein
MTLVNLALLLIFVALIALVPIGCRMTRPGKKVVPQADKPT